MAVMRGNHKSAWGQEETLKRLLAKDVKHGFALPIEASVVTEIPGAMVQPCGIAAKHTLEPNGDRKMKERLTHDMSFSITGEGLSVNDRVDMSAYTEMVYGWCLSRVIHYIVALRGAHPGKRIYIAKYDFSDAYRRVSFSAGASNQSILIVGEVAYVFLRLAFGGSPNPPAWCVFSEMVTDLSNYLPMDKRWNHREVKSPLAQCTEPISDEAGSPLAQARELSVGIPVTTEGRSDCFVDDIIRVSLEQENQIEYEKQTQTVPLAVHVTTRPHAGEDREPVPRRALLAPDKLNKAEGTPSEEQIVLGWSINTRRLEISLPADNYLPWVAELSDCLSTETLSQVQLESMIGQLNHAAFVIPLSRHFLHHARSQLDHGTRDRRRPIKLSDETKDEFKIWIKFLKKAWEGISLNLMTLRKPSQLAISDSCPYGMGGFTWSGWAWRLRLPKASPIFGVDEANNVLEFLAMVVTIKLLLIECNNKVLMDECIMSMGDNTSAIGWLFRTAGVKRHFWFYPAVRKISETLATDITSLGHCLFSQHLKGAANKVADTLSFAGSERGEMNDLTKDNPPDDVLTQRFHNSYSQIIPKDFRISPLPPDVLCFVQQVVQITELTYMQHKKTLTTKVTECSRDGKQCAEKWESTTSSSMTYPTTDANWSERPSYSPIGGPSLMERAAFLADVHSRWLRRHSELPQAIRLRCSNVTTGKAPSTSREAGTCYHPSSNS
jgi:hypothetical protein